jgi:hypothetical protein
MNVLDRLKEYVALANALGTYAAMWPTKESHDKLKTYFKAVPNVVDDFHVTTTSSKKPLKLRDLRFTIRLDHRKFKYLMFGETLVMVVENSSLHKLWQKAMDIGATWEHEKYIPHITIATEFKGKLKDLPKTPSFDIVLSEYRVDELKDD